MKAATPDTPVAKRIDQSPPPPPPVVPPTKGRVFVKESENGPAFLNPFNSDRAIEPTGPSNTLTTTPTEEEEIPKVNIDVRNPTAEARHFDERFNACDSAADDASDSVRENKDGVPKPPLLLHTKAGPLTVRTNSNGEPSSDAGPIMRKTNSNGEHVLLPPPGLPLTHTASEAPRDREHDDSGHKRRTCATCDLM